MAQKYYPFDDQLLVRDVGAAAITSSGYVGTQHDQGEAVLTEMVLVINISAIKVSAGNEAYTVSIVGSNTANRSDSRVLAQIVLGDAAAKGALETADDVALDQIVIPFRTERPAGDNHRYVDVHLAVAGTAPSITAQMFYSKPQMV